MDPFVSILSSRRVKLHASITYFQFKAEIPLRLFIIIFSHFVKPWFWSFEPWLINFSFLIFFYCFNRPYVIEIYLFVCKVIFTSKLFDKQKAFLPVKDEMPFVIVAHMVKLPDFNFLYKNPLHRVLFYRQGLRSVFLKSSDILNGWLVSWTIFCHRSCPISIDFLVIFGW